jgi:hypothetical protein
MSEKAVDERATQNPARQDWNLATLDVYLTKVIDERDRTYQQRWEASEKATVTALIAARIRHQLFCRVWNSTGR